MTTALSGSAAALGHDMKMGVELYFDFINKQGGIGEQKLELIVRDDGYEPEHAAVNMRTLIDADNVVAVIGNVGTPTAIVTVPIAKEKKILLFGAFSGGDVLREDPVSRYIINYRPSYTEETAEMLSGLFKSGIKPQEIAFFTQRDGYGNAGYQGAIQALLAHGYNKYDQLAHGRYTRNTLNVEDAVATILDAKIEPKAIIMAGGYAPSAKFITLLQQDFPDMLFLNLSFVGSHALQQVLPADVKNVIVTQVVPNLDSSLPIVDEYLTILEQSEHRVEPNFVSFEGFIIAKIFHQGLLNIDGEINKESIIDGFESMSEVDIGLGIGINYSQTDHQALHSLWLTSIQVGKLGYFDWSMLMSGE
ncbi:MAG: ligand-binding receptor [Methylophaga sp.]|nr:MAG: ligand-binding receptor [Methylophaga sp.]